MRCWGRLRRLAKVMGWPWLTVWRRDGNDIAWPGPGDTRLSFFGCLWVSLSIWWPSMLRKKVWTGGIKRYHFIVWTPFRCGVRAVKVIELLGSTWTAYCAVLEIMSWPPGSNNWRYNSLVIWCIYSLHNDVISSMNCMYLIWPPNYISNLMDFSANVR